MPVFLRVLPKVVRGSGTRVLFVSQLGSDKRLSLETSIRFPELSGGFRTPRQRAKRAAQAPTFPRSNRGLYFDLVDLRAGVFRRTLSWSVTPALHTPLMAVTNAISRRDHRPAR
jgi:hypothetical protein